MKTMHQDTIESSRNPLLAKFRKAFSQSNFRRSTCFPMEGLQMVSEALDYPLRLEAALIGRSFPSGAKGRELAMRLRRAGGQVSLAADRLLQAVSGTEHSQGVLCLFRKPPPGNLSRLTDTPQLALALVDVQDPGNCGALARSFLAFGGELLITVGATADPLGPKGLRASAGAAYRLQLIHYATATEFLAAIEAYEVPLLATTPSGGRAPSSCSAGLPAVLMIGNESSGLPAEVLKRCHFTLSLPMISGQHSLNAAVAGSILLYDLAKTFRLGPFNMPHV